MQQVSHTI